MRNPLQRWPHDTLAEDQNRRRRGARASAAAPLSPPRETTHGSEEESKKKATTKPTTLRSGTGKKLSAVRNAKGEFEDIQTYKRAHGSDVKRVANVETAARKRAGKPARKTAKKK